MDLRYPLPELPGMPNAVAMSSMGPDEHTVIRVFLVNGESRSLRLDERADVNVSLTAIVTRTQQDNTTHTHMFNVHVHTHSHTHIHMHIVNTNCRLVLTLAGYPIQSLYKIVTRCLHSFYKELTTLSIKVPTVSHFNSHFCCC